MTRDRVLQLLAIERDCVSWESCDRDCGACDLAQDKDEVLEMYDTAIAMLEEQEPIRPKIVRDPIYGVPVWRCGNCDWIIVKHPYCPGCGRKVKWE